MKKEWKQNMRKMKRLPYNFAALALFHFFISSFFHCSALFAQGSWVGFDALGRTLPTAEECPLKTDKQRTVGIFYITWHTPDHHDGQPYTYDVTKRIEADSMCTRGLPDFPYATYHWGEPEYGYFLSKDKYVCFHDLSMLADAGVDVLIMDVTNAVYYWDEWEVLFQTMQEMKALGNRVPKFCFWAFNGNVIDVVQSLYERFYKTPRYQDCWFYWDGKPLLLYNATPSVDANPNGGQKGKTDYSEEVKQFFTLRNMWWGYHSWAGAPYVGGEDKWSFGYELNDKNVAALKPEELCSKHQGRLEEMAVTPAQHPISVTGKSWRRETLEPALDGKDVPSRAFVPWLGEERENPTQYGIYFQDRWDEALQVDPDFIYLNDWNEWTAGKYRNGKDPSGQADMHIDFLGRKENPFYFVDQYNAEFNRTIAPMKGGWTDNYYMQMVQNIRRYKGVAPVPVHHGYQQIKLDGKLDEWQPDSSFLDTRGDVIHRDWDGYGNLHYTDTTGRNDITRCLVAVDKKNIYFAAETAEPLTPSTDPNWMLLYIDTDEDGRYDCLINNGKLKINNVETDWDVAVGEKCVEIAIPRKLLGKTGKEFSLRFKWADNTPGNDGNILDFYRHGDAAPDGRFLYHYFE